MSPPYKARAFKFIFVSMSSRSVFSRSKGVIFIMLCCKVRLLSQSSANDTLLPHQVQFIAASKLIDSLNYKSGIDILKKTVKLKPDYWEAFNKMAFAKIKLLDYKGAEKDLEKAEKIAPLNYETEKLRGINYYYLQDYKRSKEELDTALYINNEERLDDVELYYYRALLMFKGKAYKLALSALESATDLKPNYLDAILLKGQIRFAAQEYNYAILELNNAIKIMNVDKINVEAYKLRAKSKFEVGDFKGAVKDWCVYLDKFPQEEEALISRAAAKINANDNSGAVADLDEAIKINPKNPVSYCYRGTAKGGIKNYKEALKDLDYAIKLKFDYAAAYVNRAAIKLAARNRTGACEDLEKADALGSESAIKYIQSYCK